MDWDGFTLWLAADPDNRLCYDAIVDLDDRLVRHRTALLSAGQEHHVTPRWLRWSWIGTGVALAASLAVAFLVMPSQVPRDKRYVTAPGQRRTISLADRAVVTLEPGSVLTAGGGRDNPLRLDGRAYFAVRHNTAHPLVIRANGFEIRDIGTRFEVTTARGSIQIAVAQGRIDVRGRALPHDLSLVAGRVMIALNTSGLVETRRIDSSALIRPSRNHLDYHEVPLAFVAADVSRLVGAAVEVDAAVAQRRFSGSLAFGTRDAMTDALKELMDLDARMDGPILRLSGRRSRGK